MSISVFTFISIFLNSSKKIKKLYFLISIKIYTPPLNRYIIKNFIFKQEWINCLRAKMNQVRVNFFGRSIEIKDKDPDNPKKFIITGIKKVPFW